MNIIETIDQWGGVAPDQVAHRSGDKTLTYAELTRKSSQIAVYLHRKLTETKSRLPIAIQGHKEPEMLIAFLGAVKAGHPYIPIDSSIPEARVTQILETSQAPLVLTPTLVTEITEDQAYNAEEYDSSWQVAEEDPFYILFTSGSTGTPKGVIITRQCVESFIAWHTTEQNYAAHAEVFLNQAPFSFDLSVMDLYSSLYTGSTLFSLSKDDIANPVELYKKLKSSHCTVWVSTPSFAQLCLAEPTFTQTMMPESRKFLFCGETLPVETARMLKDRFPKAHVWNTYGPTEATVATTSIEITLEVLTKYPVLPLGYPKNDSIVALEHEVDGQGEIFIAGNNVSVGYLGRPELTEKAFFSYQGKRAYHTGDIGYFKNDLLFFVGRRDNQIKLHGHRIELGDVETNVQALPGVQNAVVLVKMKNEVPDQLVAFVILDETFADFTNKTEFELSSYLREALSLRVPAYMIPRKFRFLKTFPMTPNGKADRKQLIQQLP